ncbi:MAG: hypothetical protein IJW49_10835 [Clostridia bacterium]|nr:hypothetical protein [Clostridia bacterium]
MNGYVALGTSAFRKRNPNRSVGFCVTDYPHQKEQDTNRCPVLFGAGKRT